MTTFLIQKYIGERRKYLRGRLTNLQTNLLLSTRKRRSSSMLPSSFGIVPVAESINTHKIGRHKATGTACIQCSLLDLSCVVLRVPPSASISEQCTNVSGIFSAPSYNFEGLSVASICPECLLLGIVLSNTRLFCLTRETSTGWPGQVRTRDAVGQACPGRSLNVETTATLKQT